MNPVARRGARLFRWTAAVAMLVTSGVGQATEGQVVVPGEVPAGMAVDAWADVQRQMAQARYEAAAIPAEPDTVGAHNPAHDLLMRFSGDGARIESLRNASTHAADATRPDQAPAPALRLQTLALARGTMAAPVTAVTPAAEGQRIEYRHDGWTEWYHNTAAGLEHGYTLQERPLIKPVMPAQAGIQSRRPRAPHRWIPASAGMTDDLLRFELSVTGMRATQAGDALRFTDAAGRSLHYGKLLVLDADGNTLPATLTAIAEDRIEIAFDDSQAKYPVVVDPLLVNEEQFIPNPGAPLPALIESVALSGDTLLIGAPFALGNGAVWVYTLRNGVWTSQDRLVADDGMSPDRFGEAVAIDGDTAVVGAPRDDIDTASDQGSAYVFTRSGRRWTQQAKLVAADGAGGDYFGTSVALSGTTALVGAPTDNVDGKSSQGSAYVFIRQFGDVWLEQAQLTAEDGNGGDLFGHAVALDGDTALVGAYRDNVGLVSAQGSAYVFTRTSAIWTQQAQLVAGDGAALDWFGFAVALDGDAALVGAVRDDVGAMVDQGSAYIFARSGSSWAQQARLTPADGADTDTFGSAVALDGNTALVGANRDDQDGEIDRGSAYVFTRSGNDWTQQAQLLNAEGAANDQFGNSVALQGDIAVVAVPLSNVGMVFTRSGDNWAERARLFAIDGAQFDFFGASVALSGDTAVIAARLEDIGSNTDQGAAYVFTRLGTVWTLQQKLIADDGASLDRFGRAVALDGDTVLVGSNESAYVFVRSGTAWSLEQKLMAVDAFDFGNAVALDGNSALVGAPSTGFAAGTAHVFVRSGATWTLQQQLAAADGEAGDRFGDSVALDGDAALVGASRDTIGLNTDQGSAYVFTRVRGVWSQEEKLSASDGAAGDQFSFGAVALSGNTALVGAFGHDTGGNSAQGAAYVFTRALLPSGSFWTQQAKLSAADGASGDRFGAAVALVADTALIGANFDGVEGRSGQGSAYVFARSASSWLQQTQITAVDGDAGDQFGSAVALDGDTALIGAPPADVAAGIDGGAAFFIRILASDGDADGDGMPNSWEIQNGFNPNDPLDAIGDADGDGLSNFEEFSTGADPYDPDSDGDGIRDGTDTDPALFSNACSTESNARFSVFENTMVLAGNTVQCAADLPVFVRSTVTVEPGGRVEVLAPQTNFEPGFALTPGAELGVIPEGAP